MAMGRQKDGQGDLMVSWSEMPRSPGHVFYDRLQSVLIEGGFDAFAEASSAGLITRPGWARPRCRPGAIPDAPGGLLRGHRQRARSGVALLGLAFAAGVPATGEP